MTSETHTTWMNLKNFLLSKWNRIHKNIYCVIPFIWSPRVGGLWWYQKVITSWGLGMTRRGQRDCLGMFFNPDCADIYIWWIQLSNSSNWTPNILLYILFTLNFIFLFILHFLDEKYTSKKKKGKLTMVIFHLSIQRYFLSKGSIITYDSRI